MPLEKAISFLRGRGPSGLHQLFQIHALILKTPLIQCNRFILARLLRRCLSNPSMAALSYARSIFDRAPKADAFIWNTMIRAYLDAQDPKQSISLFCRMKRFFHGAVVVDSFSLSLVLQACARSADGPMGRAVHSHVLKLGFGSDLFVQAALIEMYAKSVDLGMALQVLHELPEPDLVSYNVLLAECVRTGDVGAARKMFDEMPDRDLFSWNTLIHGYALNGHPGTHRKLFEGNRPRDSVSWSSSIVVDTDRSGHPNEALQLFAEMQMARVVPDGATMVSILFACGSMGSLNMGRVVHGCVEINGIEIDKKLGTALLDMYSKCGDVESSLEVFSTMRCRDVQTWSAMIVCLANHGRGEGALDHFTEMLSEGIQPNGITFVGVLTACSHAGLVTSGQTYFASMSSQYGVCPKMEHYGCMVDLLGRAGCLHEAEELIQSMPFAPDTVIWRALLGACRIHKNIQVAEAAAINLLEMEPHVDGQYVLLSNVYAQGRQWGEAAAVRRAMKGRSLQKVPGSSMIEVGNAVHEFTAGDKSHPQMGRIYEMLGEMTVGMDFAKP